MTQSPSNKSGGKCPLGEKDKASNPPPPKFFFNNKNFWGQMGANDYENKCLTWAVVTEISRRHAHNFNLGNWKIIWIIKTINM